MTFPHLKSFRAKGYMVVRGVFSPGEAEQIRQSVIDEVERQERVGEVWLEEGSAGVARHPRGDMLTYEPLRRVLLDPRLLGAVREVLGATPAYWGESSVVVGAFGGARAWHTDAYHTPVTRGTAYPLVRCGLYLQDTTRYSGGLVVRPGSHLFPLTARRADLIPFPIKLVESRPGDLVIWDMRIAHAGEAVRLRKAPRLALPLSLQGRLPASMAAPEERERVVMFPTFGLPGPDLESWLTYQRTREYVQTFWKNSKFPAAVWEEAKAAGLQLVSPVPGWGEAEEVHQRDPQLA